MTLRSRFQSVLLVISLLAGSLALFPGFRAQQEWDAQGASLEEGKGTIKGVIVDEEGNPLPARLYVKSPKGEFFFAKSIGGAAVPYNVRRSERINEQHTALSAHPFEVELPSGEYELTVERGHEYIPNVTNLKLSAEETKEVSLTLKRWIDMPKHHYFSGDTHVHRTVEEMKTVVLAEDLNVTFPLTYWVTISNTPPANSNKSMSETPRLVQVDPTHVIWPVNTEYEIFTTRGKTHTQGAVFVIGHKDPLPIGIPPVRDVAKLAREEGALLEYDKHSWNWSVMIAPVMGVDLFELSNNHVWRTEFGFPNWTLEAYPEGWDIERSEFGYTEWGWIDFGFKQYYALLNCGLNMRPTAGTAAGVHPVPAGFGRVYVELEEGFDYASWLKGLSAGRSFVTTGPMLHVRVNDRPPGTHHPWKTGMVNTKGVAESLHPLDRIEVIVNGELAETIKPANKPTPKGGYRSEFSVETEIPHSSWLVVRCFETREGGRIRFAHTAPAHFKIEGEEYRPRHREIRYFLQRIDEEIARNKELLTPVELKEYEDAREFYEKAGERARD